MSETCEVEVAHPKQCFEKEGSSQNKLARRERVISTLWRIIPSPSAPLVSSFIVNSLMYPIACYRIFLMLVENR